MSTTKRVYAFCFAQDFRPIYPLYALLFADNGLSTAQISALFALWAGVSLASEVPAGVFGDRFDRRKVLAFGNLLTAPAFALWLIEPSFWSFAAGFVLWGIGGALESGTFEALVFDELRANRQESTYIKVIGRAHGFSLLGIFLATLLASLIGKHGYTAPLLVSVATTVVASAIALSFPVATPAEELAEENYIGVLKGGIRAVVESRTLLSAMVLSTIAASAFGDLEEYDSLYVADVGVTRSGVALVLAAFVLVTVFGAFLAHRLDYKKSWAIAAAFGGSGSLLMAAAVMQNQAGIIPLAVFFFVIKAAEVVTAARLQHAIDKPMRATITSVNSFLIDIAAIGIFGLFAVAGNRFLGFGLVGALLATSGALALRRSSEDYSLDQGISSPK